MSIQPIQFTKDSYSIPIVIETFLKKLSKGDLDINAKYQRGEVWSSHKKTCLAQSILGGINIPPIVLNNKDGKLIVIDGKQRISAMRDFSNNSVKFYNGNDDKHSCLFSELDENIRDRFNEYPVTAFIYKDLTPEKEREIFQRINYGENLSIGEKIKGLNSKYIDIIKKNMYTIEPYLKKFGIPSKRESYMECSTAILALYKKNYSFVSKGTSCIDYINNHIIDLDSEDFYKSISDTFKVIDSIFEEIKEYCGSCRKYKKHTYSKIKWTDLLVQIEYLLGSDYKSKKKQLIQVIKYLIHKENNNKYLKQLDSLNNEIPVEDYNNYKNIYNKRANTNITNFFKDRIEVLNNLYKFINKDPSKNIRTNVYQKNIGSCKESICKFCNTHKIYLTNFHTAHIISKKNGGTSELSNLYPSCATCNTRMGSVDMDIYIKDNNLDILNIN